MQTRHLEIVTAIAAPAEVVFDTSLAVDVHTASMAASGECAVGGVTTGRLRLGDEVTWQARHLGRSWRMTSRITTYSRPTCFVDEPVPRGDLPSRPIGMTSAERRGTR